MPVPGVLGVGSGAGVCAFTQTDAIKTQTRIVVNRQMLCVSRIDLETFQQGTFGPGEILKMRVAEETPGAKNCGVIVKIASKI